MKSTSETKDMATDVLAYIEQYPERHNQEHFIDGDIKNLEKDAANCGTTMCIAGTANFIKNGRLAVDIDSETEATELLGLDMGEAQTLFYEMNEDRALAKLKKIAKGEPFTYDDFYTAESRNSKPRFNAYAWELHSAFGDEFDDVDK